MVPSRPSTARIHLAQCHDHQSVMTNMFDTVEPVGGNAVNVVSSFTCSLELFSTPATVVISAAFTFVPALL